MQHKERLPSKSRKFKFPTVFWTLIPLFHKIYGHYNEFKEKLNTAILKAIHNFREIESLDLQSTWRRSDFSYFKGGEITTKGFNTYWHTINKAFEDWDQEQMHISQHQSNNLAQSQTEFTQPHTTYTENSRMTSTIRMLLPSITNSPNIHLAILLGPMLNTDIENLGTDFELETEAVQSSIEHQLSVFNILWHVQCKLACFGYNCSLC